MKAICPNNPEHERFYTVVHVSATWIVDEEGNFLQFVGNGEVVVGPQPENIWQCVECGADAKVGT